MSVFDLVQQQLGAGQVNQIAAQIGADPSSTQRAITAALPMLLGGMARNAQAPGGAAAVAQAVRATGGAEGGLGGLLGGLAGGGRGGLGGMLGGLPGGGGAAGVGGVGGAPAVGGLLGGLLGRDDEPHVEAGVSQASGLSGDQTKKLLMIVAPIALAALAQRRRQDPDDDEDDARLGGVLERETADAQRRAEEREPGVGGLLGKFLGLGTRPPRA